MPVLGTIDEKSLAARLSRGESGAMRDFHARYVRTLTAICARYIADNDDVKDAVQDTLVNIFSRIDQYEYRGEGSLRAWAARVAVNTSIDTLRRKSRAATVPIETLAVEGDTDEAPAEISDIPPAVVHAMIRELPDGYRTVFNLYAIDHLSHREIAQRLGIKPDTSASQYLRAKKILARKLNEYINKNDLRL